MILSNAIKENKQLVKENNRNHKESPVRRTSASSSEVPNDTHKNNFDSTFDTKSWFTDESSDQK
ncbi:unnamed protein product, partial [Adineta steineri]